MLLDHIKQSSDIKKLKEDQYPELAREIRQFLIEKISKTGGHLASNLGVVELTMALHLAFDLPKDKIVWDVGHQAYTHKLLSGRKAGFDDLRQFGGMSGFPKRKESPYDAFDTGHSSTSISAGLGIAQAREITGEEYSVISVIGDGALTGGMAYEALNNEMSISKNVGGMSRYLSSVRTKEGYAELKLKVERGLSSIPVIGKPMAYGLYQLKNGIKQFLVPGMLFEDMGLIYIGPVNGHNVNEMVTAFETAFSITNQPVLVHVLTQKGKGYKPAEQNPSAFHGVGTFDVKDGTILKTNEVTYTNIFSDWLLSRGAQCNELVSVCAAMPDGTGTAAFAKTFPSRAFDVGIAEEHAVTFAAGLAAGGMRPVVSLYSTFLQRAYDQMIHDVCLGSLPVIFTVDRSGIVGNDGETHQGIFDLSFLSTMPGMTVISPMDGAELTEVLDFALGQMDGPVAVRYPRGKAYCCEKEEREPIVYAKAELLYEGKDVLILAVGNMVSKACEVRKKLAVQGIHPTIVNMRFVKPFDEDLVRELAISHRLIVTMEDNVYTGGFSEQIQAFLLRERIYHKCLSVCFPDQFIEHGTPEELYEKYGLDAASVSNRIVRKINGE